MQSPSSHPVLEALSEPLCRYSRLAILTLFSLNAIVQAGGEEPHDRAAIECNDSSVQRDELGRQVVIEHCFGSCEPAVRNDMQYDLEGNLVRISSKNLITDITAITEFEYRPGRRLIRQYYSSSGEGAIEHVLEYDGQPDSLGNEPIGEGTNE